MHHRRDASRRLTFPVRSHHHVEAGLGAVRLADFGNFIRTRVIQRINPKAIAKIRHLKNHRFFVKREIPSAIHNVLVGTGDEGLLRLDVICQHTRLANRRHGYHAAVETGHVAVLAGHIGESGPAVVRIDHRIAPDIGHAADHLNVFLSHQSASGWAGNIGGGFGQRHLLRLCSRKSQHACKRSGDEHRYSCGFHRELYFSRCDGTL